MKLKKFIALATATVMSLSMVVATHKQQHKELTQIK